MPNTPILLITFNRPIHTRRTIEALRVQRPPIMYVFQDGARNNNDNDVVNCQAVRDVINNEINWECECYTIFSKQNRGCRDAIIYAITEVLRQHEEVIVVEDDIITSPAFYTYMCKALSYYKNRSTVFSVSGNSPFPEKCKMIEDFDYDVFCYPGQFNWGWGTWRDRWNKVDWSMSYFESFMRHPYEIEAFCRGGEDMLPMLINEKNGRSSAWDIQFAFAHFKEHAVSIVPTKSYTHNIGFDGSGTHCSSNQVDLFNLRELSCEYDPRFVDNLYFDSRIMNIIFSAYCMTKRKLWQRAINYLFRRFGLTPPFVMKKKIYV